MEQKEVWRHLLRIKIAVVGDGMVGKSTLIKAYLKGRALADTSYRMTVGADIFLKEDIIDVNPMGKIKIQWLIWDLAGQQRFNTVRPIYYSSSRGLVAVYDITRRKTFVNLPAWLNEAIKFIGGAVPIVLVANKIDLRQKNINTVKREEGEKYSRLLEEKLGVPVFFVEASAINNLNVGEVFGLMGKAILSNLLRNVRRKK